MVSYQRLCGWVALMLALSVCGCGPKAETTSDVTDVVASASDATTSAKKDIDPASVGSVSGVIKYAGAVESKAIQIKGNPECAIFHKDGAVPFEELISKDGALKNAFVYIQSGHEGYNFPKPTTSVMVENKDCIYIPHVVGVQVGQTIEVVNSDPTLHNVHSHPKKQAGWNIGLPSKGMKKNKSFDKVEVAIPVKCDVHPWMLGYVAVVDSPLFALTGDDGKFEIKNIPAGKYTLAIWHEKLGEKTQAIEVAAAADSAVEVSY